MPNSLFNCSIYCVYNSIDKLIYIGHTTESIKRRLNRHFNRINRVDGVNTDIYKHIKKLGKKVFNIKLLQYVENVTKKDMMLLERLYIEKYNTIEDGLNMNRTGKYIKEFSKYYDRKYMLYMLVQFSHIENEQERKLLIQIKKEQEKKKMYSKIRHYKDRYDMSIFCIMCKKYFTRKNSLLKHYKSSIHLV